MSQVYWIVLLLTILLGAIAEKNPRENIKRSKGRELRPDPVFAFLLSAILVLVAGLRHGVGTDYWAYYRTNVASWETVWNAFINFKEPGIRLLSKITRDVWDSGTGLIFISSLITVGIYCLVIYKHSAMYLVSMLIFLFLGDWTGSFNGVRQYLAAAVLFAGHRLILERKLIPYIIVVMIASLFHTTALVMIVPYFLLTRKPDFTQFVLLLVGSIIIRFSYDFVFSLIGGYKGTIVDLTDQYITNSVNPLRIATCFIPVVLYFTGCRSENLTKEQAFYINGLFFNAFAMLSCMGSTYLGRIGLYTNAMVTIGYSNLFLLLKDDKYKKGIIYIIMIVLLLYWLYSLRGEGFRWIFE